MVLGLQRMLPWMALSGVWDALKIEKSWVIFQKGIFDILECFPTWSLTPPYRTSLVCKGVW